MELNVKPDEKTVEQIAANIFHVMPLLRKRLLRLDVVQAEHGIPLSHAQVLAMLSENKSMSVSEISRRLGIAKPNITPLVDRLIASDLVDRVRDTGDRRVRVVQTLQLERLLARRAPHQRFIVHAGHNRHVFVQFRYSFHKLQAPISRRALRRRIYSMESVRARMRAVFCVHDSRRAA